VRLPLRLIIVRRDQPAVFQAILSGLGRWPTGTAVMWDRRERAAGPGQPERRSAPESMWHTHGFIMIETNRLPADAIRLQPLTSRPTAPEPRLLPVSSTR